MRLDYNNATLAKLTNLVKEGKTNAEICKEFGVDPGYPSLCQRAGKIRKELGIPQRRSKKSDIEKNSLGDSVESTDENITVKENIEAVEDVKKPVEDAKPLTSVGLVPCGIAPARQEKKNLIGTGVSRKEENITVVKEESTNVIVKNDTPAGSQGSERVMRLNDYVSDLKKSVTEFDNYLRSRFQEGFTEVELKMLGSFAKDLDNLSDTLEETSEMLEAVSKYRKGK